MQVDADLVYLDGNAHTFAMYKDNSATERFLGYIASGSVYTYTANLGVNTSSVHPIGVSRGDAFRHNASISSSGNADAVNGDLDTFAVKVPNGINNLRIGVNHNNIVALNGCLLNVIYYQKRLTNSVLEANSAREYSND